MSDAPTSLEIAVGTSVEWSVYDADWIGTGTIIQVKSGESDGLYVWEEATLRITETLKGIKKEELKFACRLCTRQKPSLWQKDGCEILLFLSEGARLRAGDQKYAGHEWAFLKVEDSAFRLDRAPLQSMLDLSFAAHQTKENILAATRAALRSMQKARPESIRVPVAWPSPAYEALYGGSAVYLIVPLDTTLEKRARGWLGAKDPDLAVSAAQILGRFRSDENVAALKGALSNSHVWIEDAGGTRRRKVYAVRREAIRVLREWGISFTEPIIEVPARDD